MEEGKVVIVRVPNRKLSEIAVKTLMHWITLKTFMTCQLMEIENRGAGTFIVFKPYDNSFLTKRHAQIYGRHWRDVEKMTSKEIG
ncbi:MAG: hypothetical protein ACXVNF_13675 [Neobacillus sp.]